MRLRPSTASHARQEAASDARKVPRTPNRIAFGRERSPATDLKPATLYAVEALHEKYKFGHHSLGITKRQGGVT